jgi:predicted RNA polymerase sigma factor
MTDRIRSEAARRERLRSVLRVIYLIFNEGFAVSAAEHAKAPRAEETNWGEILGLYALLERVTGNPMVALNRAIAAAMVDGPQVGLALLDELDEQLAGHHRLHSTRAHLLEDAGERRAAAAEYERAAELTKSIPERNYLTKRAARLNRGG